MLMLFSTSHTSRFSKFHGLLRGADCQRIERTDPSGCIMVQTGDRATDPMQETCIAANVFHILGGRCAGKNGECEEEVQGNMDRYQMMLLRRFLRDPDCCCLATACQQVKPLAQKIVDKYRRGSYTLSCGWISAFFCAECGVLQA